MAETRPCGPIPCQAVPEIPNADVLMPLIIIGVCLFLMTITWFFTRRSRRDDAATALQAQTPIVGQTKVTQAQLGQWHRAHGDAVRDWIENHESVLKRVSDGGLSIDLNLSLIHI